MSDLSRDASSQQVQIVARHGVTQMWERSVTIAQGSDREVRKQRQGDCNQDSQTETCQRKGLRLLRVSKGTPNQHAVFVG